MKRRELKNFIFECYLRFLLQRHEAMHDPLLNEDEDKDGNMVFGEGEQLPDATDQIIAKFPTLKHALIRLHSDDWQEFVQGVEWVSPRPTIFRIKLTNGQDYTLKWLGKDFEATISGKSYYIGQLTGYQQALNKLATLYQEGPMPSEENDAEGGEGGGGEGGADFGGAGGGGGDFPGGEEGGEGAEGEGEGDEGEGDKGGEDMETQDIDFESDADI